MAGMAHQPRRMQLVVASQYLQVVVIRYLEGSVPQILAWYLSGIKSAAREHGVRSLPVWNVMWRVGTSVATRVVVGAGLGTFLRMPRRFILANERVGILQSTE